MRLVQVVRCGNDDRIDLIELEEVLEVGEHIRDLEPFRDRACFRSVVVTERNELRAFDLREHGQMRQLRNCPSADEPEADVLCRFRVFGANRRFGQSSSPGNKSLESYDSSARLARARSRPTGT